VGENVIQIGEDIESSAVIFGPGHRLRPQDIGGLTALGITEIDVARKPRTAIISTGDEVIPPGEELGPGKVRDINSYTLSALVEQTGGTPDRRGIVPDKYEAVLKEAETAIESADILVITAGSSVSVRDITVDVIESLGAPGVLVHGVSLKPGKPTILAVCGGKPVIGLPGNPVSALVAARLFLIPAVETLLGADRSDFLAFATVKARLTRNISSLPGREDYIPVRLFSGKTPEAEPVFGKSNLIYTLVHADGLITVPLDANGLHSGEEVEVVLFS
jgi:molybdopterin molybdotransferase